MRRLLGLAVLGAAVYIAYHYASPQIRAWRFRDAMTQTARLARASSDEEMRASLGQAAEDLGIPLAPRDLRIQRERGGRLVVTAAWKEVVVVDGGLLGTWTDTLYYVYEAASIDPDRR